MIADRIIAPIFSLIVAATPKLLYDVSISFSKEFFKTSYNSFSSFEKAETSGVTRLGGKETVWTKPAHRAAKVNYLPSKRKSLEREI